MELFYTFPNTHSVILAEQALLLAGVPTKVRPLPSVIAAGCGLCLCIPPEMRETAENEMRKISAMFSAVYKTENGQFELIERL